MAFGSFGGALQSFAGNFVDNTMFNMPVYDYFPFDYFPNTDDEAKKPEKWKARWKLNTRLKNWFKHWVNKKSHIPLKYQCSASVGSDSSKSKCPFLVLPNCHRLNKTPKCKRNKSWYHQLTCSAYSIIFSSSRGYWVSFHSQFQKTRSPKSVKICPAQSDFGVLFFGCEWQIIETLCPC